MYANNAASASVLMLAARSPYDPYAYPAAGPACSPSKNMHIHPRPGAPQPVPASYSSYNCNAYAAAYGAFPPYPQYAAARLGGSGAPSGESYLRQQRTIEIIALEEVPAPLPTARRRRALQQRTRLNGPAPGPSVPASSSAASSSTCTSSSGDDDDEDEEDDDEEEGGESYCSSEEDASLDARERVRAEVSFQSRMRRIEQWRSTYAKAVGTELAPSPSRTTSKRKGGCGDDADGDIDNRSRTSKRSRNGSSGSTTSASSSASSATAVSVAASARSAHSCSACDACFPDASSLKRHGSGPATNDACRAAVEYGFEGCGKRV